MVAGYICIPVSETYLVVVLAFTAKAAIRAQNLITFLQDSRLDFTMQTRLTELASSEGLNVYLVSCRQPIM
jgi:hypothetical protein